MQERLGHRDVVPFDGVFYHQRVDVALPDDVTLSLQQHPTDVQPAVVLSPLKVPEESPTDNTIMLTIRNIRSTEFRCKINTISHRIILI